MEEFGRAGQLVERGPTHLAVRPRAERSVSHQTEGTETDRGSSWLRHASYITEAVARRKEMKPNVSLVLRPNSAALHLAIESGNENLYLKKLAF